MANLGSVRTLLVAVRLQDAGVSAGLAKIHARTGLVKQGMGSAAASINQVRAQLFFLGFTGIAVTGALVKQASDFEKQITLASLALDGTTNSVDRLEERAFRLAKQFQTLPTVVAATTREINQLGLAGNAQTEALTRAALGLDLLTGGELAPERASTAIFRLINLTSRSKEEFDQAFLSAEGYASAIVLAGDASASGIAATADMVQTLAGLGPSLRLTREEIIALAAAFGDVDETRKRTFTTAISRIFSDRLLKGDTEASVAALIGVTPTQMRDLRREDPAGLLRAFAGALKEIRDTSGVLPVEIAEALGFEERDKQTLDAFIASIGKYDSLLPQVREEIMLFNAGLIDQTQFASRMNDLLDTTSSRFQALAGAVQGAAISLGNIVSVGVVPLIGGLTTLGNLLQSNPLLGPLLIGGAGFALFNLVRSGARSVGLANLLGFGGLPTSGALGMRLAIARGAALPIGAGAGIGAGVRAAGLSGLAGVGGALAPGLIGRAPLGALAALGGVGTALGVILALVAADPLISAAADGLADLGEKAGGAGVVFSSLAVVFSTAEVVTSAFVAGMDLVFTKVGGWSGFLDTANQSIQDFNSELQQLSDFFRTGDTSLLAGGGILTPSVSPGAIARTAGINQQTVNNYYLRTGDTDAAFRDLQAASIANPSSISKTRGVT